MGRPPASVAERTTRGTGVITSFGGLHLTGVVQVTGRWGGLLPASSWSPSAQMETQDVLYHVDRLNPGGYGPGAVRPAGSSAAGTSRGESFSCPGGLWGRAAAHRWR